MAIAQHVRRMEFERDVMHAYQTVRIGLMVKRKTVGTKTTVAMPKWDEVIGRSGNSLRAGDSHNKGRAFLQMVAARTGSKVRKAQRAS